jgi:hypothetical protein
MMVFLGLLLENVSSMGFVRSSACRALYKPARVDVIVNLGAARSTGIEWLPSVLNGRRIRRSESCLRKRESENSGGAALQKNAGRAIMKNNKDPRRCQMRLSLVGWLK